MFLWEFCINTGMSHPLPCERGHYCPSASANQRPCPSGTYGNLSGLAEQSQCTPCDPGMYCKGAGIPQSVRKLHCAESYSASQKFTAIHYQHECHVILGFL